MKKQAPKQSNVIYAYSNKKSKDFLNTFAEDRNQSVSYIINAIVDELRENPRWQKAIKTRVPSFVTKAKKWQESRLSS